AQADSLKSIGVMVSHIGTLIGVLLVPWLCDRVGRKKTVGVFFLLTPIAVLGVTSFGDQYGKLLILLPVINFFAVGISAALALYFPQLFPTSLRATGAGMAYNVGRVFSIAMPILTGFIIAQSQSIATGFAVTACVYVVGLAALPFLPETRG